MGDKAHDGNQLDEKLDGRELNRIPKPCKFQ